MGYTTIRERVAAGFCNAFGVAPTVMTRAPGRLEILGNHTDYNEGLVLSVAVDRETVVAAAARLGAACRLLDLRSASAREFRLDDLSDPEPGDWANYVKGVVVELQQRGIRVPAFDLALCSSLPISAGMSSSAALEMSSARALGELAGTVLSWQDWARVGQGAENTYVGARTGLLDQFSSLKGKAGHLVKSDFRTLEVGNVPLPQGTDLVVANSMIKHTLTNEYNERRASCEDAVRVLRGLLPGIGALRDVSMEHLVSHRAKLSDTTFRRAVHVVGENERVQEGAAALERGDVGAFGRLMFASHESSRVNFENSCAELDLLVELGASLPGAIGARLSGGGFGGATVHLVEHSSVEAYRDALSAAYTQRSGREPQVMICQAADGACVLPVALDRPEGATGAGAARSGDPGGNGLHGPNQG